MKLRPLQAFGPVLGLLLPLGCDKEPATRTIVATSPIEMAATSARPSPTPSLPGTDQAYLDALAPTVKECTLAADLLARQAMIAANNPSLLHDPSWLATTDRGLNALQDAVRVLAAKRTVPADMQKIDDGYREMASEGFVIVMYYPDGVNAVDPSQSQRAIDNINQLKATAMSVQQEVEALRGVRDTSPDTLTRQ